MPRVALISGITGQDGSYLAELLLDKGYDVHGLVATYSGGFPNPRTTSHVFDLADGTNLTVVMDEVQPDEVYHLAAQSHVRHSFDLPVHTADVTGVGVLRVLEAIRQHELHTGRKVRFYQASSSEMFGKVVTSPQNEETPFHPRSPYACAKVYGYWQTRNYREAYGMYACNGILFNHESPRRGEQFVTRKITRAAGRIKVGLQDKLYLGNIEAHRDWGFAGDYVEAMWRMLQHDEADDYVVATGETHSVREFLEAAFSQLDLDWQEYVDFDTRLYRPTEVDTLRGDASKARDALGWEPQVDFQQLVRMMAEHDHQLAIREKQIQELDADASS